MTPKQSDPQQRFKGVSGLRSEVREAKIQIRELRNLREGNGDMHLVAGDASSREARLGRPAREYGFGRWGSFVSGGQTREARGGQLGPKELKLEPYEVYGFGSWVSICLSRRSIENPLSLTLLGEKVGQWRPLRPSRRRWMKWEDALRRFARQSHNAHWRDLAQNREIWRGSKDEFAIFYTT